MNQERKKLVKKIASLCEPLLFLRPDGFGKSHLVSELATHFSQEKMPVLALHFGERRYESESDLDCVVQAAFSAWESVWHIERPVFPMSEGERFARCILGAKATTGKNPAILIDDYDFPMLSDGADFSSRSHFESVLSSLYGALSTHSAHVGFALLTGVTRQERLLKFAKPRDVSEDSDFSVAAGFSAGDVCALLAQKTDCALDIQALSEWYGGYNFAGKTEIFNAGSVIRALEAGNCISYFPAEECAKKALERVQLANFDFSVLLKRSGLEATAEAFFDFNAENPSPIVFLVQTGFLTKKAFDKDFGTFSLFFPNRETRAVFFVEAARRFTAIVTTDAKIWAVDALRALEKDDLRTFFSLVNQALYSVGKKRLRDALTALFGLMSVFSPCFFEDDGYFTLATPSFLHTFAFDLDSIENAFERLYKKTMRAGEKSVRKTGVLLSAESGVVGWRTM